MLTDEQLAKLRHQAEYEQRTGYVGGMYSTSDVLALLDEHEQLLQIITGLLQIETPWHTAPDGERMDCSCCTAWWRGNGPRQHDSDCPWALAQERIKGKRDPNN